MGLVALLAGCSESNPLGSPVSRNLAWFNHVGGEDIRPLCADGKPHYRFVYNGRYEEQVRSYTVVPAAGGGAALETFVRGVPNFVTVDALDPVGPYRGNQTTKALTPAELRRLEAAVASSVQPKSPAGLRLPSDSFYWTVAWCEGGRFRLDAVLYPSDRWAKLAFIPVLKEFDPSGVDFAEPYPTLAVVPGLVQDNQRSLVRFSLTVGNEGLVGLPPRIY